MKNYNVEYNPSAQINVEIFGALFTLSLSILILNSQLKEGAKYVNVRRKTLIKFKIYRGRFRLDKKAHMQNSQNIKSKSIQMIEIDLKRIVSEPAYKILDSRIDSEVN